MSRLFFGLLLASCAVAASAAGGGRQRLAAFLSEMVSFQADFTQTVYDERRREVEGSRGTVFLQRPGRFRWSYTEPYPQEIVADGERVWVYDSDLAQVTVQRLDRALGNTPALLLTTQRPLEESFVIEELSRRGVLEWLELKPKRGDATFASMRLGLDERQLRVMELADSFGQVTELRFSAIRKNPQLDPGLFTFSPPPGVDVVGDADRGGTPPR